MDEFRKVDFRYFITLAMQDKIPWTSLLPILTAFTQSLSDSNQVIEVLLCELERLKLELQKNQGMTSENRVAHFPGFKFPVGKREK